MRLGSVPGGQRARSAAASQLTDVSLSSSWGVRPGCGVSQRVLVVERAGSVRVAAGGTPARRGFGVFTPEMVGREFAVAPMRR